MNFRYFFCIFKGIRYTVYALKVCADEPYTSWASYLGKEKSVCGCFLDVSVEF